MQTPIRSGLVLQSVLPCVEVPAILLCVLSSSSEGAVCSLVVCNIKLSMLLLLMFRCYQQMLLCFLSVLSDNVTTLWVRTKCCMCYIRTKMLWSDHVSPCSFCCLELPVLFSCVTL